MLNIRKLRRCISLILIISMIIAIAMLSVANTYAAFEKKHDELASGVDNAYSIVDSWRPTSASGVPSGKTASEWQSVTGTYFDGQYGAGMQIISRDKDVITQKNVIASGVENLFYVALKIKAKVSWADVLDATGVWLQNGNAQNSSKIEPFLTEKPVEYTYKTVYVDYVDSVSPDVSGNIVYTKEYYIAEDLEFNTGQWFLYWGNPLLDNHNHSYGQKNNVVDGERYRVPVGEYMSMYDQVHHSVVCTNVSDEIGDGIESDSAKDIVYITEGTEADYTDGEISWSIHPEGTIKINTFSDYIMENMGAKKTYYREYNLVYAVHLDASRSDFKSRGTYSLNNYGDEADLEYTYDPRKTNGESTYPYPDDYLKDIEFANPTIKGTLYKLQLKKTDALTGQPLKSAIFKISGNYGAAEYLNSTDYDNGSYEFTAVSDENGMISFNDIPWGNYTITELSAPPYYGLTDVLIEQLMCYTTDSSVLVDDESTFLLNNNQIKVVENTKSSMDLKVMKKWSDDYSEHIGEEVTVHLLANGSDTGKSITLNDNNDWTGMFEKLDLNDENGRKIVYRIREDDIYGYSAEYTYHDYDYDNNVIVCEILNTYRSDRVDASASIIKVDEITNEPIFGVGFELRDAEGTVVCRGETGTDGILKLTGMHGNKTYYLYETRAATGYYSLDDPWAVIVDKKGKVTITDSLGQELDKTGQGIWVITNTAIYELPDAGGTGAYIFTILGSIIMSVSLIWLKKRCGFLRMY